MKLLKEYILHSLEIFISSLYMLSTLLTFLIYTIMFSYEQQYFSKNILVLLFSFYNFFFFYKILIYFNLFTIKKATTNKMFPKYKHVNLKKLYKNINPYTIEFLRRDPFEKLEICNICKTYKPKRTRHCHYTNQCYLKYDHYCRFLQVPIGFYNYKAFFLFIVINLITNFFPLVCIILDYIYRTKTSVILKFNYIISIVQTGLMIITFLILLGLNIFLISNNETMVEFKAINAYMNGNTDYISVLKFDPNLVNSIGKTRKTLNEYNISFKENWKQVFGNNALSWFLPYFSSLGDGIFFQLNTVKDDRELREIIDSV